MTNSTNHVDAVRVEEPPASYAVMLNARARGWTGEIHAAANRYVPSEHLFLTDDFRQARKTIEKLLDEDYDVIFTGGGDGTVVYLMNAIEKRIADGDIARDEAPPVGVLKLGTGNAIATYLGAGPVIEDLQALGAGAPLKVREINLVDDGQRLFPFGGFGWDAQILNDYDAFKDMVRGTLFERLGTGLQGYGLSIATRTLPKVLLGKARQFKITNLGERALKLDETGQVIDERGADEVLFRGRLRITSPATIPYWGFGVRMFPYCNLRPEMFELRWYTGSISRVVTSLPSFWRGAMPPSVLGDWLVSKVRVEVEDGPMAYQVAGDAAGSRDRVVWQLAEHRFPLAVPLR